MSSTWRNIRTFPDKSCKKCRSRTLQHETTFPLSCRFRKYILQVMNYANNLNKCPKLIANIFDDIGVHRAKH